VLIVKRGGAAARARALAAELDRLAPVLRGLPGVVAAYAFGSAVAGGVHATSDLDLLVIRTGDAAFVDRVDHLRRELAAPVPVDLFVYTPEELAAGGRFVDYVLTHGRMLW